MTLYKGTIKISPILKKLPTGTINIDSNGTHDVANYAIANVSVSGGSSNNKYVVASEYLSFDGSWEDEELAQIGGIVLVDTGFNSDLTKAEWEDWNYEKFIVCIIFDTNNCFSSSYDAYTGSLAENGSFDISAVHGSIQGNISDAS